MTVVVCITDGTYALGYSHKPAQESNGTPRRPTSLSQSLRHTQVTLLPPQPISQHLHSRQEFQAAVRITIWLKPTILAPACWRSITTSPRNSSSAGIPLWVATVSASGLVIITVWLTLTLIVYPCHPRSQPVPHRRSPEPSAHAALGILHVSMTTATPSWHGLEHFQCQTLSPGTQTSGRRARISSRTYTTVLVSPAPPQRAVRH